jgi:hypothetical protein
MFIGHYAAALAIKSTDTKISLGWLFIAVQLVDIVFFPLAYLGIEKFNIVPNFTESTHFELEFMPYTHGLVGSIGWALIAFLWYRLFTTKTTNSNKLAALMGLAVLSHWFFDLLMHTPDLPILGDKSLKLGFGLWNNAVATFSIEAILILSALWLYLRSTTAVTKVGKYGMTCFVVVLIVINIMNIFGPPPESKIEVIVSALAAYFLFAGVAFWLDPKRI